ncbi:hypothetical protein CNMCM5793_007505 [Aspergillus hiratsukae]|uniref:Uncharacterized protein n=1 Tax=Aspergillus hiratsukae TaxID=1194566 RepID=A0A8H6QKD4_9EURO|nr:hypothetical protein CNMCM5793_007505 [Aspergillus hiratsukae]KAF7174288.1 hypothetical protein CNMCM6106_008503 [Aspergillus hiratsukae]
MLANEYVPAYPSRLHIKTQNDNQSSNSNPNSNEVENEIENEMIKGFIQQHTLTKLAARTYRRWFHIRGVFLRGVPGSEKVLVSCEDGEIEFGEGERMNWWTLWRRRLWIEMLDTVPGGWDVSEAEGEQEADEEGYLGDSEEMSEDDEEDEEEWDVGEDEKLLADCPVAMHEVKTQTVTETKEEGGSYVAFVGHLEDSRSMASLILGISGVEMDDSK